MSGHLDIASLHTILREAKRIGFSPVCGYSVLKANLFTWILSILKLSLITNRINDKNLLQSEPKQKEFVTQTEVYKGIQKAYKRLVEIQNKAFELSKTFTNIGIIDDDLDPKQFYTVGKVDRTSDWVVLLKYETKIISISSQVDCSFGILMKDPTHNNFWFTTEEVKAIIATLSQETSVERNWGERIWHQSKKAYDRFKDRPVSLSKTRTKKPSKSIIKKKSYKEHFNDFRAFLKGFNGAKSQSPAKHSSVQPSKASDQRTLKTTTNIFDPFNGGV